MDGRVDVDAKIQALERRIAVIERAMQLARQHLPSQATGEEPV